MTKANQSTFVLCLRNEGYQASLEPRKLYRTLPDAFGATKGLLRVIDESGEDYLYPAEYFVPISLPDEAVEVFEIAA